MNPPLRRENCLTVHEAAEIMGCSPGFLYIGLRKGRFPFGIAIQGKGGRWVYWISRQRFFDYLRIPDPKEEQNEKKNTLQS